MASITNLATDQEIEDMHYNMSEIRKSIKSRNVENYCYECRRDIAFCACENIINEQ